MSSSSSRSAAALASAAQMNPDRETAYRYWGDALSHLGKNAEAREKYLQAIVAEPYNQQSLDGLNQWAGRVKVTLNWVRLQDRSKISTKGQQTKIIFQTSPQEGDPAGGAWLAYGSDGTERF